MRHGLPVLVAVLLASGLIGLGVGAVPAQANVGCSNSDIEFIYQTWAPPGNDAYGIRAPIDFRDNGVVCQSIGTASSWIGLQQDGSNLTQIGFLHYYDTGVQTGVFCKFWENYPALPVVYDCGDANNDVYTYFMIYKYPVGHNAYYGIADCGTGGGYGNCTVENGSQSAYTSPVGVTAAEVHGACETIMMRTSADEERYGTDSYPLEGLNSSVWNTRTWNPVQYPTSPSCAVADYSGRAVSQGFRTYDTR